MAMYVPTGPPLDIGRGGGGGGGWSFCLVMFIYFTREIENFIFFTSGEGGKMYFNIYTIFISTSYVEKTFISTKPCGIYLFHPFFSQKYLFQKTPAPPPPSILMVGP